MVTAQTGSFTAASSALRVSQPGLGTLVRKLEEELQTELLIRHSRGVEVTDAGRYLLRRAEQLFAFLDETASEMSKFAGAPHGLVRVGLNPSVEFGYGAELLRRCHEVYPGIKVNIVEALSHKIERYVHDGEVDIGIFYAFGENLSDPNAELIREENAVFLQKFTPDAGDRITFAELCEFPLVIAPHTHGLHKKIREIAEERGRGPQVLYEVESIGTIIEAVRLGLAGTILPMGAVQALVDQKQLCASTIVKPQLPMQLAVSTRSGVLASEAVLLVKQTLVSMLTAEEPAS